MRSLMSHIVRIIIRLYLKPHLNNRSPIGSQRRAIRRLAKWLPITKGTKQDSYQYHGRQGEWVSHESLGPESKRVIIYAHGGAFTMGGIDTHLTITSHLAKHFEGKVLALEYSLAPEHIFPAAVKDIVAAYNGLLQQGYPANQIALAGDSAGANLVLAAAVKIRNLGEPMPSSIACLSPWVDLTLSGETITKNRKIDPLVANGWLQRNAQEYAAGQPLNYPELSPLFDDLSGLPPVMIQVGTDEILFSDAERLDQHLKACGVESELDVWSGMWHVWHGAGLIVPESRRALRKVARFLKGKTV